MAKLPGGEMTGYRCSAFCNAEEGQEILENKSNCLSALQGRLRECCLLQERIREDQGIEKYPGFLSTGLLEF